VQAGGSQGFLRVYRLSEKEAVYTDASGNSATAPARQSFEVRGNLSQQLARGWFLRGRADYFSDVSVRQAYHTDIYDASSSQRTISANLSGSLRSFTLGASFDRSQLFYGTDTSIVTGATPRIQVTRGERPLLGSPVYFGATAEFSNILKEYHRDELSTVSNLTRADFMPTIRLPFTKLRWLTLNTSLAWRATRWSRSLNAEEEIVDEPISRRYFDLTARVVGPIFNRVWNTPGSFYAEKFKHTIEPSVTIQRVTSVDNFDRIVQIESGDYVLGGTTRITYGVTNRFMAKRKRGARPGQAQEFLNIGLSRTYYTDARASQYDLNYATSGFWGLERQKPSNFSPWSLTTRLTPADGINATVRMEYDPDTAGLKSLSASGQVAIKDWVSVNGGYSQRRIEDTLDGGSLGASVFRATEEWVGSAPGRRTFSPLISPWHQQNSVFGSATLRVAGNRLGGSYSFNYDIEHSSMLNSRFLAYYNAQCCGFSVEYQSYNRPFGFNFPIQQDNRFNFSFTLAGLGTFSNFFGALGGGSQR
jgi:lipopolysaccharide assembly outer membrane protein LptD (OstA)